MGGLQQDGVALTSDPENQVGTAESGPPSGHERAMSWILRAFLLANIGVASLIAVGWSRFGSVSSALGFVAGDRLVPDSYTKEFAPARQGEGPPITFYLTNCLDRPVTVIGFQSSCTCAYASGLPLRIEAGQSAPLRVRIKADARKYRNGSIQLYTDDPMRAGPTLTITGTLTR